VSRLIILVAALALAAAAVGILAGSLVAQPGTRVYKACEPDRVKIDAAVLPEVVDQDLCPVAGRTIEDHGAATVVPEPGESVFSEAMSPEGNQQLVVINPPGDRLLLREVGREGAQEESGTLATRAGSPTACSDPHYYSWNMRLNHYIRWYFNAKSTPSRMSKFAVLRAMKRAGGNVSGVQDVCGVPDHVPAVLRYVGTTRESVNISTGGACGANDRKSVVGFGDLPAGYTGKACVWAWIQEGPDRINSSDVRLNKFDYAWTARVTDFCRGRRDVESTMTHERGHTFGLGDASEASHANLTMSYKSNGPCQISERTLGRGDAIGLNRKY
jgi:hypothetical protein